MRKENVNIRKIKDWFIIQRIRTLNFIKEHKFLSVGIAVFLMSCIAFLIVYATDTKFLEVYEYDIVAKNSAGENIADSNVYSFDTVSFNLSNFIFGDEEEVEEISEIEENIDELPDEIPDDEDSDEILDDEDDFEEYPDEIPEEEELLSNLKIKTEVYAEGKEKLDAYWVSYNMQMEYEKEADDVEDKSKAIYIINNATESSSYNIYLKVNNVEDGTKVTAKITINDGEAKEINFTVKSNKVSIVPTIVPGAAYKKEGINGRYMPFGILLGLSKEDLDNNSLKGKYFDQNVVVDITTSQRYLNIELPEDITTNPEVLLGNDNKEYFGFYDVSKNLLNIPHYIYNSEYSNVVYNSGNNFEINKKENSYEISIKGITTDGIYYQDEKNIYLSSSFITVAALRGMDDEADIEIKVEASIGDNTTSVTNVNYYESQGSKTNEITINKETSGSLTKLSENDFLAYGEEAVISSKFTYSKDADNTFNFTNIIPIGKAKVTTSDKDDETIIPFEMVEYSNSLPYYISINNTKIENLEQDAATNHAIKVQYAYYCTEDVEGCDNNIIWEDSYKSSNVLYIKYEINNINPGSQIDFRVRVKAGKGNQNGSTKVAIECTNDIDNNISNKVGLKVFKIESNILIDGKSDNIVIDGSNKNQSTMAIYPYISLPAKLINSNAAGLSAIESFNVIVMLPDELKYIPNNNYLSPKTQHLSINIPSINLPCFSPLGLPCISTPSINIEKDFLVYSINAENSINDWIDPIYLDFNYNPLIGQNEDIEIKVFIEASFKDDDKNTVNDAAVFSKNITYLNNEDISYNQSVSNSNIEKDSSFTVSVEAANKTEENKSFEIITLLPPNELESTYNGTYELESIPEGALCSVTSMNKQKFEDDSLWQECSQFSDDNYSDVTAVKVSIESLAPNTLKTIQYKINVSDNEADDKYIFKSYLINGNSSKEIGTNIVTVFSKKITGIVWEDFDGNGLKDENEKPIEGIELALFNENDEPVVKEDGTEIIAITDENGMYSFTDLQDGNYYVVAVYDTTKYGLSPKRDDIYDKSIKSSFSDFSISFDDIETQSEEYYDEEYEEEECEEDECFEEIEDETEEEFDEYDFAFAKSDSIAVTSETKIVSDINLGLSLNKIYTINMKKYITKAEITNALGITTTKDFGTVSFAKLDVKDINNLIIKVVYTIELENTGSYPGYIYAVKDFIPDGMSFNETYEENKGWVLKDDRYLENNSLSNELINAGEKKYLSIAFDITRKEAGTFINYAVVDDEDLQILAVSGGNEGGNKDE